MALTELATSLLGPERLLYDKLYVSSRSFLGVEAARAEALQDKAPHESMWRLVDGVWGRG